MNKILLILLFSFGLGSCLTTEDIKPSNKKISTKISSNQIKEETKKIKFIQWKCYEYKPFHKKYENLILTIGYFSDTEKLISDTNGIEFGKLILESTSTVIPTLYSLNGVQHNWDWGLENKEVVRYKIQIETNGTARFWDFTGAKRNQKIQSKEHYECKAPETIRIDVKEFEEVILSLKSSLKD